MTASMSTQRYLEGKRTVDDRALDRRVLERFTAELAGRASENEGVRIVELGAGVGTMVARLAAWGSLPTDVTYRAVDRDRESIAHAHERLPSWLEDAGYDVETREGGVLARKEDRRLEVTLEVADAFEISGEVDAVIAAAFLDLVDLERALASIGELLVDGGLLYAPITYDGTTRFAPAHPLDDRVEQLYHRHMDEIREGPGSSRAGRDLLEALAGSAYDVLAVGGSDWIVRPVDGSYPADERAFLEYLLGTIDDALAAYPAGVLEPGTRRRWMDVRRRRLEGNELVFVAGNLDVLARLDDRLLR
ncbi:class I SAM-dependent methyltransferase [Natrialbaceae archaeon A-gly3]